MFWGTFTSLQLSPDQLRPYGGCLVGFTGDQVEVRGYVKLRTTFFNNIATRMITIRYIVVNASSAYNRLRPYDGCLVGFTGDQVEVRGYVKLRTTFFNDIATRMITIRYIVVNASSAYNLLLGRPSLNILGAVASTTHMKMKLPSSEGGVITIKSNQKTTRKCYESSLKNRRGRRTRMDYGGRIRQ